MTKLDFLFQRNNDKAMEEYLIISSEENKEWYKGLHIKGFKVRYESGSSIIAIVSDEALVEIQKKYPELKIDWIYV